ncbi:hypothetical protein OIV36_05260 [Burkholderia pseudomallei]|uniref:hypothetical protein n=1 Tax=Burkholderia pseudomallei TaxID=28450 RepID=UPI0021F770EB|nr:hypothetical protein [Burkholderia pseudomallei]MCW0048881.1 hypothetical protein [Burkholderia pseudomallei]
MENYRQNCNENEINICRQGVDKLPSLAEFWDALASYSFTQQQGAVNITRFFELDAIAQCSPRHERLMSQFWDAAFDGGPRPARPGN